MDRKQLMEEVAHEAFARRIGLSQLCAKAGVSRTVAYRWLNGGEGRVCPTLATIGKLERALDTYRQNRA